MMLVQDMVNNTNKVKAAVVMGCFLTSLSFMLLSLPSMPLPWLAWVAMAPLFFLLKNTVLKPVVLGLIFFAWAFTWWASALWWLIPATISFTSAPWFLVCALFCLLMAALSMPYLLAVIVSMPFMGNGFFAVLARVVIFCACIEGMAFFIPANLTHTQFLYPEMIQVAAFGGSTLLLFFMLLSNYLLACVSFSRQGVFRFLLGLLVPVVIYFIGAEFVHNKSLAAKNLPIFRVLAIQPNLSRDDSLGKLFDISEAAAKSNKSADLLVWPEFPPAISWSESTDDKHRINQLLQRLSMPLLMNSSYVFMEQDADEFTPYHKRKYYNAMHLISTDGRLIGSYYKQRLVPFFEYIPFESKLPWLRNYFKTSLRYLSGVNKNTVTLALGGQPAVSAYTPICYEAIFNHKLPVSTQAVINVGNDGWFNSEQAAAGHLALIVFRAVENNIDLLRVTNSGYSTVVNHIGQIKQKDTMQYGHAGYAKGEIRYGYSKSVYRQYGDWFLYICYALSALFILLLVINYLMRWYKNNPLQRRRG